MKRYLVLLILCMGGSLHAMQTHSGHYFEGWHVIPTYIDSSDMGEAIQHGLWLALKYDEALIIIARQKKEIEQLKARKRKKRRVGLRTIPEEPEKDV